MDQKPKKPKYTIEVYRAKNGEFAWRAKHRNGKIVADGSETYKRRSSATRSLYSLIDNVAGGDYDVEHLH